MEGHLCVPYVQKTQQSPSFGCNSALHFSQVYFNKQTSVGISSIFLCPHSGQVISDLMDVSVAFAESIVAEVLSITFFSSGVFDVGLLH